MSGAYIVVLRNAVDSENRLCAAYVGGSGRFDTTDAAKAQRFSMRLEAEERANHWARLVARVPRRRRHCCIEVAA